MDKNLPKKHFPHPIKTTLRVGAITVVLLDVPPTATMNNNLFGLDTNGNVLWQIQDRPHGVANSPYVDIGLRNGKLMTGNWDGEELEIDSQTGSVLKSKFRK